ncbi:MAG: HAD-IB family phosphatase [Acidobacteriales bacterium]|nr:HAD-IB family phosphatase [Terriglobales bacterium]
MAAFGSLFIAGTLKLCMATKIERKYLFASDFDQTLTFRDSGYVLCELIGVPTDEFERKATGMAKLNLVQQGAELAYLLLHDPEFRTKVRREHLHEVGKKIRLKENVDLLFRALARGIGDAEFEPFVLSAAPVEIVRSALEGILPQDRIYGTEFRYSAGGEIDRIVRTTAGYGKVAAIEELRSKLGIGPDHIIYVGDGSSDIHVMLHVNAHEGFTIAVSESMHVVPIAKRTVLSTNAFATLVPVFEKVFNWERPKIRAFFEENGVFIREWERARTDWLTLGSAEQREIPAGSSN